MELLGLRAPTAARSARGAAAIACCLLALAGCQAVPSTGPLASDIVTAAGRSAAERQLASAAVFDIVAIDAHSAHLVSEYRPGTLKRTFGAGRQGGGGIVGVGDQLRVVIFEASSEGLFSTTDSKQTVLDIVVQPDGNAAIPYAGSVRFAGRSQEQIRQSILAALRGRAIEPDVIVTTVGTASRVVTVSGAVHASGLIPLGLVGNQITEVIAKAGGPSAQPYESYVTLTRGSKTAKVLLKHIIEQPSENVYVLPGDQVFLTRDPRTFTVLGETVTNNRIEFGANDLNLLEAIALAGGGKDERVNAAGYFIFRYEERPILEQLISPERFRQLVAKGMVADKEGRYPVVYRIDMKKPDSLIVGQTFPIKNRDVVYAARHPSVDLAKFLTIIGGPVSLAATVVAVVE